MSMRILLLILALTIASGCTSMPPVPEFKDPASRVFVEKYIGVLYGGGTRYFSDKGVQRIPAKDAPAGEMENLVRSEPETALKTGLLFLNRATAFWERYKLIFRPDASESGLAESRTVLGKTVLELFLGRKLVETYMSVFPDKSDGPLKKANEIIGRIDGEMVIKKSAGK